ncbi:hypothetical protein EVAR_81237_1 [Eumeta japonica]|uniref:Uncharacterized protein n=1 Tax=Eumeta variegata TaxID=151549 RepID=A0A4C1V1M1_EUMVA|nr:hypothetical protein EVAR_81237_1 [Eumeta japonica]
MRNPPPEHTAEDVWYNALSLYMVLAFSMFVHIFYFVISLLVVLGAHMRRPRYMKYFFIAGLVNLVLNLVVVAVSFMFMEFGTTAARIASCNPKSGPALNSETVPNSDAFSILIFGSTSILKSYPDAITDSESRSVFIAASVTGYRSDHGEVLLSPGDKKCLFGDGRAEQTDCTRNDNIQYPSDSINDMRPLRIQTSIVRFISGPPKNLPGTT